jgi:hypothetical protein
VFASDKLPPLIGLVICWNAGGSAERPHAHRPHPQLGSLNFGGAVCKEIINGEMGVTADRNYVDLIIMLDRLCRLYLNVVRLELEATGIRKVNLRQALLPTMLNDGDLSLRDILP